MKINRIGKKLKYKTTSADEYAFQVTLHLRYCPQHFPMNLYLIIKNVPDLLGSIEVSG